MQSVAFYDRYSNLDSKDPTDLIMVDLQNTRIGRPGIDLSYFFCSSTSPQQRKDHFDELLRFYYDCFFEELRNLGNTSEPYFTLKTSSKNIVSAITMDSSWAACIHR